MSFTRPESQCVVDGTFSSYGPSEMTRVPVLSLPSYTAKPKKGFCLGALSILNTRQATSRLGCQASIADAPNVAARTPVHPRRRHGEAGGLLRRSRHPDDVCRHELPVSTWFVVYKKNVCGNPMLAEYAGRFVESRHGTHTYMRDSKDTVHDSMYSPV